MTQKKSYSRYFIILQEDEKGYALASDKLPSGYAKLEIKTDKCKVSYYVQNLKKESAPYYMILICNKKDVKKIIKLSELNIDEHGRADISYEYPVDSVGNSGISVDKVIGAGIVRFINSNLISVMSGFASNEIPEWRGYVVVEEDKQRLDKKPLPVEGKPITVEEKVEAIPEVIPEAAPETKEEPANIFEEYEMKIDEMKTKEEADMDEMEQLQNRENEIQEQLGQDDNRHKNKAKEKCKDNDKLKENVSKIKEDKFEDHKPQKDNDKCEDKKEHKDNKNYGCEEHKEKAKESVGGFFKELTKGFEEMQGFCSEIKRCKWYKVPVRRVEDMNNCVDYNKYTVVYYPMLNYYQHIRRFGHFIMGHKYDKDNKMKYLVYGIPGTKSRMDQPYGGRTGFVTWIPLKDGDEEEGSYGYWLMFYDFRNSTIVIPVK